MDEAAKAEVAHDRPADLEDLGLAVVLEELVEERLVDVVVVDVEALGIMERGLFGVAEVGVAPGPNLRDGLLFEGRSFP